MKRIYIFLGIIEAFTAIGAIPAGIIFLMDTSGAGMGNSTALLENSPFHTFLIPGLFLLIINGLGSATGAVYSFMKRPFAGPLGIILGIIMCLWIILQVNWIGLTSFLQPLFLIVGITEALLGWQIVRKRS